MKVSKPKTKAKTVFIDEPTAFEKRVVSGCRGGSSTLDEEDARVASRLWASRCHSDRSSGLRLVRGSTKKS